LPVSIAPAGKKLGRPKRCPPKIEAAIREHLSARNGILKMATLAGETVQRVKREMVGKLATALAS
jgi:hypothetical protein